MFQSGLHLIRAEVIILREAWQDKVQRQLQHSRLRGGRAGFWLTSRIHPLSAWGTKVWIKRDDELGPLGSKWRKMQGLTAALQDCGADTLVAWGGSRSQFLQGLLSLGRELGIGTQLLVKEGSPRHPHGPDLLWPLLSGSVSITTIARSAWPQVENMAKERCERLTAQGSKVFCVKEGGAQIEALWGSLTLAWDIVQQEKELGLNFAQIWVDAGTGLTAQALILGLGLLKRQLSCEVVLCAGTEEEFKRDLEKRRAELAAELLCDIPLAAFRCHRPLSARSFGSTNQAVFQEIQRTAAESGILLDPIYSAKLFMSVRAAYAEREPDEPVLILHAGGVSSLFGFPQELAALGRSGPSLTS